MIDITAPDGRRETPDPVPVVHVDGQVELFAIDAVNGPDASVAGSAGAGDAPGLTDDGRAMLDFERRMWLRPGAKEQQIRVVFGVTPVVYFQRLRRLINTREALAYAPTVVNRLLRVMKSRVRAS